MTEFPLAQERRTSERRSFSLFDGIKIDRRSGVDRRAEQHGLGAGWDASERRTVERRSGEARRLVADRRSFENA